MAAAVSSVRTVAVGLFALFLSMGFGVAGGCQCYEEPDRGWEFTESRDGSLILDAEPDIQPDAPGDATDVRDLGPDTVDVQDVLDPDGFSPPTNVLNDSNCGSRTSLVIDRNGTEWLGFHRGEEGRCDSTAMVTVAHLRDGQRAWAFEEIAQQNYLTVLAVNQPDRPIVGYPVPDEPGKPGGMRVSRRRPNGTWRDYSLPTTIDISRNPGFDVSSDEDHYYVSFAGGQSSTRVEFFSFDVTQPGRGWEAEASLNKQNPSAALERGLRADLGDSAYLVHRRNGDQSPFGLARYDKVEDRWPQTEYFDADSTRVHSFVVTEDFELCMSSTTAADQLMVTCGTMFDLDQREWVFRDQPEISSLPPSSMAVGDDGSLYVAYNLDDSAELRVAKLEPGAQTWRVTTIFDSESSGVSTDVSPEGRITISFFACRSPQAAIGACPLKVVREAPDSL